MVEDFTPPRPLGRSWRWLVKSVNWIKPDQLGNVNIGLQDLDDTDGTPAHGDTYIYNSTTNVFETGSASHGWEIDQFDVTDDATDEFVLSHIPISDSWNVSLNGVTAANGVDYTITSDTLTVLDPTDLFLGADTQGTPWLLQVQYDYLVDAPPTEVPTDMLVWLQGSEWDTLGVSDGTAEDTWHDVSGNNNHAVKGLLGNGGLYFSAQTPTGGGVVRFGGANGAVKYDLPTGLMAGITAGEVFVVLKSNTDTGDNAGLWFFGTDTVDFTNYPNSGGGGSIGDSFGTNDLKNTGNPSDAIDVFHLYNVVSKAGEWTSRINGSAHYTTATNTVGWRDPATLGYIPTGGSPSTYVWDGDIAEFILYGRELTTSERAAVVAYLQGRHGL